MKLLVCVFIITLFAVVSTQQSGSTSFPRLEKRYHLQTASKESWYTALHYCSSRGMRLASILSREENERIVKPIRDANIQGADFWVGGTNLGTKPQFYWMGQENKLEYTNWHTNEPSTPNGNENCIELRKKVDFLWNDAACHLKKYFVCEEQTLQSNFPATQSLHDIFDLPKN